MRGSRSVDRLVPNSFLAAATVPALNIAKIIITKVMIPKKVSNIGHKLEKRLAIRFNTQLPKPRAPWLIIPKVSSTAVTTVVSTVVSANSYQ